MNRFSTSILFAALVAASAVQATPKEPAPTPSIGITQINAQAQLQSSRNTNRIRTTATGGRSTSTSAGGSVGNISLQNNIAAPDATPAIGAGAMLGNTASIYKAGAAPVSVAAPQQPLRSCRLGFGAGGSGESRAFGFNIPMGNDGICLADAQLELIARNPNQFTDDDKLRVSCRVEGMAELSGCKKLAERESAQAASNGQQPPASYAARDLQLLP